MKAALAILALTGLVFAAACSNSRTLGHGPTTPSATSAPGALPPELQEVMDRVAEIRGLAAVPALHAEIVSREALPALLDSLITDEDRDVAAHVTTLYRLLGHFRPDQDYLSIYQSFGADSVLGLYSPLDDTLWVVSDSGTAAFDDLTDAEESTLAHEMVHAIQDYHFALDETYYEVAEDPDRNMAWTVVVEGDASYHQQKYTDKYLFAAPAGGRLFSFGVVPQVTDIPPSFIREMLFPYTTGEAWIGDVLQARGQAYLDDMLANPPLGTVCVLHLQRCLDGFEPVEAPLPDLSQGLGDGWSQEWTSTLGEFHLGNFLNLEMPLADASGATDGWSGDSFATYTNGAQSVAVFHVEFNSLAEADEFRAALANFTAAAGGQPGTATSYTTTTDDGRQFAVAAGAGTGVIFAISSVAGPAARALDVLGTG